MARSDARTDSCDQSAEYAINRRTGFARAVQRRDDEHQAQCNKSDTLEDAQRTGLKAFDMLQIKAEAEQCDADCGAKDIADTNIHDFQVPADYKP